MRQRTGRAVACGVLAGVLLAGLPARAETVEVVLRMTRNMTEGPVRAGTVLGRGDIHSGVTHSGYALWLENETDGDRPGCYRLTGEVDRGHVVRVCLSGDGWYADEVGGAADRRWVYPGSDRGTGFTLVSAVDQRIAADTYVIRVNGGIREE